MPKPVMLIGLYSRPQMIADTAIALSEAGFEDLAYQVAREKDVVHYDVDTLPERGDALDHFHEASVVIAHHLYYDEIGGTRLGERYYYNRRNQQIVDEADHAGVPLFVFGDYPMRARRADRKFNRYLSFRLYLPR